MESHSKKMTARNQPKHCVIKVWIEGRDCVCRESVKISLETVGLIIGSITDISLKTNY